MPNRWLIALAGVVMQIALGAVYAWSVFRIPLTRAYGWSIAAAASSSISWCSARWTRSPAPAATTF